MGLVSGQASARLHSPAMCEVTCEEISFGANNSSMLLMDEEGQWVACGRKLSKSNSSIHTKGVDEDVGTNNNESFNNLPLELCDPMRRKITSLKPSLTPGAGTRIMRRRRRKLCQHLTALSDL